MAKLVVIGAGAVGRVVVDRCASRREAFPEILWISRSEQRLLDAAAPYPRVRTLALDADDTGALSDALTRFEADIVVHAALPYQNLSVMRACVDARAHYIDTSVPEVPGEIWSDPNDAHWYGTQWAFGEAFKKVGRTAVLSIGSDPGLVNVFCRYAAEELLDEVTAIDVVDVNAGRHGFPFATNFNPEINLREVQCPAWSFEQGQWRKSEALARRLDYDFPEVGPRPLYLMDHDELHSLCRYFQGLDHLRFWMGFSDEYIDYFNKLRRLGLLSHEAVDVRLDTGDVVAVPPLRVLSELLPNPPELASRYEGKVVIGTEVRGKVSQQEKSYLLYSAFDHQTSRELSGTHAIAFFAGVPPAVAACLLAGGVWDEPGVYNVEQLRPGPFLEQLSAFGLEWAVVERASRP